MPEFLGWTLIILPGFLYLAQVLSAIDFSLAQKIGIQENPAEADQLLQRAERYVAYWDLVTLIWMPVTGLLVVFRSELSPLAGLIGGAIYLDAAGREAAKMLSFKHERVRIGGKAQQKIFFASYFVMGFLGLITIIYAIDAVRTL